MLGRPSAGSDVLIEIRRCQELFEECLNIRLLMEHEWAENKLALFKLWASGMDAVAPDTDSFSVDARVGRKTALVDIFVGLLQMLAEFLKECQALGKEALHVEGVEQHLAGAARRSQQGEPDAMYRGRAVTYRRGQSHRISRSISPWSDQSSLGCGSDGTGQPDDDRLAESMKGVESMLYQLDNLSLALRPSETPFPLQEADWYFKQSEHSHLKAFLTSWILSHTGTGPSDAFSPVTNQQRLTSVQRRLVYANLRRRNRFLYAQKHSQKPSVNVEASRAEPTSVSEPDTNLSLYADAPTIAEASVQQGPSNVAQDVAADSPSVMRLGAPTEIINDQIEEQGSLFIPTSSNMHHLVPPPMRPRARSFECPCCYQLLDPTFCSDSLWRGHLTRDIRPYTCIYEKCSNPEATFATRQAWMDHMTGDEPLNEMSWSCLICADGIRYQESSYLSDHIMENHSAFVTIDQMPTLLDASLRTLSPASLSCPLCGPNSKVDPETAGFPLDHIAEHIHSFAFLSLPCAPDTFAVDSKSIQGASEYADAWLEATEIYMLEQRRTVNAPGRSLHDEQAFAEIGSMHANSEMDSDLGDLGSKIPEVIHLKETDQREIPDQRSPLDQATKDD